MLTWYTSFVIVGITMFVSGDPNPFDVNPPNVGQVGTEAVVNWTEYRISWAESSFKSSVYGYNGWHPSPDNWFKQIIYEIQVDRFNNGNLTNDKYNLPSEQKIYGNTSNPYGLPEYRHGGDLQGIIDRLPYLADLGITALWITPILTCDSSYHGYCTVSHLEAKY